MFFVRLSGLDRRDRGFDPVRLCAIDDDRHRYLAGEKPTSTELIGLAVAFGGLVYLVLPGLSSPPLFNAGLMAAAGIAWGIYTLRGRSSGSPLADTTGNFIRTLPFILLVIIPFLPRVNLSDRGIVLAALSGTLASGVGYTVWYAALKFHTSTRAAILQLAVPSSPPWAASICFLKPQQCVYGSPVP